MAKKILIGSEKAPYNGAKPIGKSDPAERLEVSIILRMPIKSEEKLTKDAISRKHEKREDFAKHYAASHADIVKVEDFATQHGLVVVEEHAARRTVILSGSVAQFNAAFGVDLQQFEHAGGTYRGRTGAISLPDELSGVVQAVLGLDNRPAAQPHFRSLSPCGNVRWQSQSASLSSFLPGTLAALYGFPAGTGQGECIGLIELGGGYRSADLQTYFKDVAGNVPGSHVVSSVSVDQGKNQPTGDSNGPDGEVMLDIEVAGSIAPDARIVVYFAPNTDAGFLDAVTTAVHDTNNKPSIISISWGGPESAWTQQAMTAFDQAFQAAAAMGITVCVASGDNGSSDGVNDGGNHVNFPASSPYALACGGSRLQAANGKIQSETVWNDGAKGGASGGGISSFFAQPAWQKELRVTLAHNETKPLQMRGVPDVAGDADPETGYEVRVDGQNMVIGGTSAVAPLWAGLIARMNSTANGAAGYINPLLYKNPSGLVGITQGNNGAYYAAPGWNAATGLGRPNGPALPKILFQ